MSNNAHPINVSARDHPMLEELRLNDNKIQRVPETIDRSPALKVCVGVWSVRMTRFVLALHVDCFSIDVLAFLM